MEIRDINLAEKGKQQIEWAAESMPVLGSIMSRFAKEEPLNGLRISACLHITKETGVLARALKAGGAEVFLCASNPLSTQDDVAASLAVDEGIEVYAIKGENKDTYYRHLNVVLDRKPDIAMDDGADLTGLLHNGRQEMIQFVKGGTEETTTGVIRLKGMEERGLLRYPVFAINNADTKHLFDNRYGTGQSVIDAIMRVTNRLFAGSCFVVCGYGWCGRGVSLRARGMGARVIVTEVNPVRALEAVMEGYQVLPMSEAAQIGDFFCTVTGDISVIRKEHFEKMKDGAIVCNSGHFNVELDLKSLEEIIGKRRTIRESLEEFRLHNGRKIYILCEGRLVNLSAAEGAPSSVMDMSFTNQALCVEYLAKNGLSLEPRVYDVPPDIDREVAMSKLKCMGIFIDALTQEQSNYLHAWELGT
ncbi:MAG: adenosylhomocysteinase [Deltaproteobacteria bacterium]|nr:adenosylhomocysteinase [Deltaproteobacteria bacterium]